MLCLYFYWRFNGGKTGCATCQLLPSNVSFQGEEKYKYSDQGDPKDGGSGTKLECDPGDIATGLCISTHQNKCVDPHNHKQQYGQILTCRTPKIAGDAYKLDDDGPFPENWLYNTVNINTGYNSLKTPSEEERYLMTKVPAGKQIADYFIATANVKADEDASFSACDPHYYVTGVCVNNKDIHSCGTTDNKLMTQGTHSVVKCNKFGPTA